MPPDETAEIWSVARSGLAVLLAAVIVVAVAMGMARGDTAGSSGSEHSARARSNWRPRLDVAGPHATGEPAAIVLMRGGRLSLGSLDADDLRLIDGIGPQRARALVAARRAGALRTLTDADRLPGFGPQLVSRLAASLAFAGGGEEQR